MTSRQRQARIGWIASMALLCAVPVWAQSTPAGPRQTAPPPSQQGGAGSQTSPNGQNPGVQPNGTAGAQMGAGTETGSAMGTGTASQGKSADKKFVKEAAEGSNAEIALGKLAQEKGNSADVKQFGERMVTDHTKLNEQMQPVAQQMGITVSPDQIPAKDKALEAKLQALSGDAFDKAYIRAMVKDHSQDVKQFQHEAASAKDPALKQAVEQGLPVIQEHLQIAQQMAQAHNVKVSGGGETSAVSGH